MTSTKCVFYNLIMTLLQHLHEHIFSMTNFDEFFHHVIHEFPNTGTHVPYIPTIAFRLHWTFVWRFGHFLACARSCRIMFLFVFQKWLENFGQHLRRRIAIVFIDFEFRHERKGLVMDGCGVGGIIEGLEGMLV